MLPTCTIGAKVDTWRELISQHRGSDRSVPKTTAQVREYSEALLGYSLRNVIKGENEGWFADQHIISILIKQWQHAHVDSLVRFVPRDVSKDRIDRSYWSTDTLEGKVDAHLLEQPHRSDVWFRVTPLLRQMFGKESPEFHYVMTYFEQFQQESRGERQHRY